ncbi:hypothetical protein [uncultured Acetatifactor sp.]|nr:hypothetical protein [uncultured Acetatifactor sp.]
MIEFENALEDDDFGYVAELVRNSDEIQTIKDTAAGKRRREEQ